MVAILVFWGITSSQPTLYNFALLWGLFGGGFSATWSGYGPAMQRANPDGNPNLGLTVALMAAGRGVGAVISGPLSEKLLEVGWESNASFAYGTVYGRSVSEHKALREIILLTYSAVSSAISYMSLHLRVSANSFVVLIAFSGVAATFGGTACVGRLLKVI